VSVGGSYRPDLMSSIRIQLICLTGPDLPREARSVLAMESRRPSRPDSLKALPQARTWPGLRGGTALHCTALHCTALHCTAHCTLHSVLMRAE
jgi:hypothetical protein